MSEHWGLGRLGRLFSFQPPLLGAATHDERSVASCILAAHTPPRRGGGSYFRDGDHRVCVCALIVYDKHDKGKGARHVNGPRLVVVAPAAEEKERKKGRKNQASKASKTNVVVPGWGLGVLLSTRSSACVFSCLLRLQLGPAIPNPNVRAHVRSLKNRLPRGWRWRPTDDRRLLGKQASERQQPVSPCAGIRLARRKEGRILIAIRIDPCFALACFD